MAEPDEFLLLLAAYGEDIDDWADSETWLCAACHDHRFRFTAWLCNLLKGD